VSHDGFARPERQHLVLETLQRLACHTQPSAVVKPDIALLGAGSRENF